VLRSWDAKRWVSYVVLNCKVFARGCAHDSEVASVGENLGGGSVPDLIRLREPEWLQSITSMRQQ
jgi:hypothetical protein